MHAYNMTYVGPSLQEGERARGRGNGHAEEHPSGTRAIYTMCSLGKHKKYLKLLCLNGLPPKCNLPRARMHDTYMYRDKVHNFPNKGRMQGHCLSCTQQRVFR